ncbi:MAG: glyoxalase, partial [Actinomycetota bacterium]|nr:glyoxalase [Actinomycetota bacterium]
SEMVWRPEGGRVMVHSRGKADDTFETVRGRANVYVVCDDPDAVLERATRVGATLTRPMEDSDYGSRGFSVADAEGNSWSFGTYAG